MKVDDWPLKIVEFLRDFCPISLWLLPSFGSREDMVQLQVLGLLQIYITCISVALRFEHTVLGLEAPKCLYFIATNGQYSVKQGNPREQHGNMPLSKIFLS